MRKGFKYWLADNKLSLILCLIGGLLFDVANINWVAFISTMPLFDSLPVWASLIVAAIVVGAAGCGIIVLSNQVTFFIMGILYGLGYLCYRFMGEHIVKIDEDARQQAVFMCAFGLSVAYWIGYRFFLTWIIK